MSIPFNLSEFLGGPIDAGLVGKSELAVVTPPATNLANIAITDSAKTALNASTIRTPQDWFNAIKTRLGPIGLETFQQLLDEFNYTTPSNEALANTDVFLQYLDLQFQPPFNSQTYTNPNSKTYTEILAEIKETIENNSLQIAHQSDENQFGQSKSIAILIPDSHDDSSRHKQITNLMLDLYSNNIPLSSGFQEGDFESKKSQHDNGTGRTQIDKFLASGFDPEKIVLTLLASTKNPALSFQPEKKSVIDGLKRVIKDQLSLEAGFPTHRNIERNRTYFRKTLLKYFSNFHSGPKNCGYEYFIGLCLLVRKILDKETNLNNDFKQRLYEKFFKSLLLYNETQTPNSSISFDSFKTWDSQATQFLHEQITTNKSIKDEMILFAQNSNKEAYQQRISRNKNISQAFIQAGQGTRIMRLGRNHLKETSSGPYNLGRLLEEAGFAVIVI